MFPFDNNQPVYFALGLWNTSEIITQSVIGALEGLCSPHKSEDNITLALLARLSSERHSDIHPCF